MLLNFHRLVFKQNTMQVGEWQERSLLLCAFSARRGQKALSREGSWWAESHGSHPARARGTQPFLCPCPGQRALLPGAASSSSSFSGEERLTSPCSPQALELQGLGSVFLFFSICNFHFCALAGRKLDIIWFFWSSCCAYRCYLHSDLHF